MKHKKLSAVALVLALLLSSLACIAGGKGHLGFATSVAVSGWIGPVLKWAKVNEVVPDSPAAKAGLLVGDELIEINGKAVNGAPARAMGDEIKGVKTGEHLRLKVKRVDGSIASIDITAG